MKRQRCLSVLLITKRKAINMLKIFCHIYLVVDWDLMSGMFSFLFNRLSTCSELDTKSIKLFSKRVLPLMVQISSCRSDAYFQYGWRVPAVSVGASHSLIVCRRWFRYRSLPVENTLTKRPYLTELIKTSSVIYLRILIFLTRSGSQKTTLVVFRAR